MIFTVPDPDRGSGSRNSSLRFVEVLSRTDLEDCAISEMHPREDENFIAGFQPNQTFRISGINFNPGIGRLFHSLIRALAQIVNKDLTMPIG